MQLTNCKHCGGDGKLRNQGRGFEVLLSYICSDCWAMYVNGIWQEPKAKAKSCPLCGKDLWLFIDRKECVEYDTLDEPGEPFRIEITGSWRCGWECTDNDAFPFESQTFRLALTVEDLERLHNDNL